MTENQLFHAVADTVATHLATIDHSDIDRLTDQQRVAIAITAGVGFEVHAGKITTEPFSISLREGVFVVASTS